ncbi:hypothetical protein ANO11243_056030 [Dothideomycetidae sp. 11243]|nr:hypothetical protein ANO11243_056030 [fungal sp. No.11243]
MRVLLVPGNRKHLGWHWWTKPSKRRRPADLRHCICVRVPVDDMDKGCRWSFTLSSDEGFAILLPSQDKTPPIRVTFGYALLTRDQSDEPALLIQESAGPGGHPLFIDDPVREIEDEPKDGDSRHDTSGESDDDESDEDESDDDGSSDTVGYHLQQSTQFLHRPRSITVGAYEFDIFRPPRPRDAMVAKQQLDALRRVSYRVDEAVESKWGDIGKYLGRGQYGEVRLVQGMQYGTLGACKTMVAESTEEVEDIEREIAAMDQLDHPNLTKLYEPKRRLKKVDGELQGWIKLIMQPCHGNLKGLIARQKGGFPLLKMLKDTSEGLAYMHSKSIIHRDIKPQNILWRFEELGASGFRNPYAIHKAYPCFSLRFLLTDFGFSKTWRSLCTSELGSPGYMAPEIGVRSSYTSAVDIYALGVTWLEACQPQKMEALEKRYSSLKEHRRGLQILAQEQAAIGTLGTWIKRMMSLNDRERPQASELEAMLKDVTSVALIPGDTGPARRLRPLQLVDKQGIDVAHPEIKPAQVGRVLGTVAELDERPGLDTASVLAADEHANCVQEKATPRPSAIPTIQPGLTASSDVSEPAPLPRRRRAISLRRIRDEKKRYLGRPSIATPTVQQHQPPVTSTDLQMEALVSPWEVVQGQQAAPKPSPQVADSETPQAQQPRPSIDHESLLSMVGSPRPAPQRRLQAIHAPMASPANIAAVNRLAGELRGEGSSTDGSKAFVAHRLRDDLKPALRPVRNADKAHPAPAQTVRFDDIVRHDPTPAVACMTADGTNSVGPLKGGVPVAAPAMVARGTQTTRSLRLRGSGVRLTNSRDLRIRGHGRREADNTRWRVIIARLERAGRTAIAIKNGVKGFAGAVTALLTTPERARRKRAWKLSQIRVPGAYVSLSDRG